MDGEYIVVFKQDAEDHESKSLLSSIIIDIFDYKLITVTVVVLHHKQHVESVAKFIGLNHEVRREFNIGTSNYFRGYSVRMDDRSVFMFS